MFYSLKPVQFIFLTIIALSLVLSGGHTQSASAQSKNSTPDLLLASPGTLDPTFDGDGRVTTAFGNPRNEGHAVAIQPDGKILVAGFQGNSSFDGDFALARYNNNGSLDSSFDTDGKVTAGFDYALAQDIAIQSDGKIVVAGQGYDDLGAQSIILARFNSSGSLDTSFDTDGKVITGIGFGHALAIQSDGKLLVTGTRDTGTPLDSEIVLARYNTNGSLDTTFDSDGYLTNNPGSYPDAGTSIILQPDGKILVGGYSYPNEFEPDYALIRYNADGSLDTSFSGDGIVITSFSNNGDYGAGVALQPDGKIIFAGSSYGIAPYLSAVLMRFNNNGTFDTTFDGDGKASTSFANESQINDVALQSNGKIVVAGVNSPNNVHDFANDFFLLRYNANGSLDTSFDTDGKVTTDLGSTNDIGRSIAIQSDGNIVVAGSRWDGTNSDFAVARYIGDTSSANIQVDISGNANAAGVTLNYTDVTPKSVTSSSNGNYSLPVSYNWTGTITPSHVCFTFNPGNKSYNSVTANQTAQNYNATFNAGSGCKEIDILIAGNDMGNYGLLPGSSLRASFDGVDNGPVKVKSTNGTTSILAAMRAIWREPGQRTSYTELMGLPVEQLSTEYWFPWYNNATPSMDQGFRIANVDSAQATIKVMVGTTELDSFTLGTGASVRKNYNVDNGPIRIFSTNSKNILAGMRVIWKEPGYRSSYSEMMGLPVQLHSAEYWFPWYNNAVPTSMDQGLRIAVP